MKKIILLALVVLLSLTACVPDFLNSGAQDAPAESVDVAATVDAAASTQAVETFAALASPTMEEPTAEATVEEVPATATETLAPTETATLEISETATETPEETLSAQTETVTGTPEESLSAETATITPTATNALPTLTPPISINEPPASVPRHKVKVRNNTKVSVYISLHGSTEGGYKPIVESPLGPWQKIKLTVPEGYYTIVVYVGSDPIIDHVYIHRSNTVEITIKEDSIKVVK